MYEPCEMRVPVDLRVAVAFKFSIFSHHEVRTDRASVYRVYYKTDLRRKSSPLYQRSPWTRSIEAGLCNSCGTLINIENQREISFAFSLLQPSNMENYRFDNYS